MGGRRHSEDGLEGGEGGEVVGGYDCGDGGGSRWWEQLELAELLGFSCRLVAALG